VIFFVWINDLNQVKVLRNSFPRKKCEFVPWLHEKIDWKNDLGKSARITITTTSKFQKVTNIRKLNILKWLFISLKRICRRYEEAPQNLSNRKNLEVWRISRGNSQTWKVQISFVFNTAQKLIGNLIQIVNNWKLLLVISGKGHSQNYNRTKFEAKHQSERFKLKLSQNNENRKIESRIKIVISTYIVTSLTIYLQLICQSIEINPGPTNTPQTVSIITYNTNGLADVKKLKRLLKKVDTIVNQGGIIMLQETHLKNDLYLKSIWKHSYVINCKRSNSGGLVTLFNNEYKVNEEYTDEEGRQLIIVISKEEEKYIIANSYHPNDHRKSIDFTNNTCEKIIQLQQSHPDADTIYAGDFNMCISREEDSLNRNRSKQEDDAVNLLTQNNKIIGVRDAFRSKLQKGGFTWNRGNCFSRLDHIFMSNLLISKIKSVKTDWAFENSDHAAVIIKLFQSDEITKGPGLVKINTEILKDKRVVKQIEEEINAMMEQAEKNWNPHVKLEFLKMCIRTIFSKKVMEQRKIKKTEIEDLEEELNQMETLKIEACSDPSEESKPQKEKIESAMTNLKTLLQNLRNDLNDSWKFNSIAKWFEYGERSNKFFLNLNRSRQKQKLIHKIKKDEVEYKGQEEVKKCIKEFYQELYSAKSTTIINEDSFYKNCPKLSPENKKFMDEKIALNDLSNALKTCKDSAPGPDGIPYIVYKTFWNLTGQTILDAWNYSMITGNLTASHIESIITLLPKEGKNADDIKNWRPITLSNCDSKIITKAMSNKMSKVLNSIIDPAQTAYIPGRSVSDNLRANYFTKTLCKKRNMNSVLISLDAKKAFDSVDHNYIKKTLQEYGFGEYFIRSFEILYTNITARILVNGFTTESIKIERGVKQGDALSCALFIICIDPLLRNLNTNKNIKSIIIGDNKTPIHKAAAFADDISVVCGSDNDSIQQVFNEYEKLTIRSGLELNADKTEILIMNSDETKKLKFKYNGSVFEVNSVKQIKICGLFYCTNEDEEYSLNVREKIKKLENRIRIWSHRHLTMEGKALIVKTFGLSQLIYNMQSYVFKTEEIIQTERIIFKFLWSNGETQNGVDRIKRSIMKNKISKGGLNMTDVECLNRSLKLRQFIRAQKSCHVISDIQKYLTGSTNILQEYRKISKEEAICYSAQDTINKIIDSNRIMYAKISIPEIEHDKLLIDEVSSMNLDTFLTRKNRKLASCVQKTLTKNNNIITLGDLIQTMEHEKETKTIGAMKFVLGNIPNHLIEIAKYYSEDTNCYLEKMESLMIESGKWMKLEALTTKQIQETLKTVMKKTDELNVKEKLNLEFFEEENILQFRRSCKNPKLRNIYFRLLHNDFFTQSRMKKYKMIEKDECPRCGLIEDTRHLLWNCSQAKNIWSMYNNFMKKSNSDKVTNYEEIFIPGSSYASCLIKIRVIQEMIQIERPRNWTEENIKIIVKNIIKIENHNSTNELQKLKFHKKWDLFLTIN